MKKEADYRSKMEEMGQDTYVYNVQVNESAADCKMRKTVECYGPFTSRGERSENMTRAIQEKTENGEAALCRMEYKAGQFAGQEVFSFYNDEWHQLMTKR